MQTKSQINQKHKEYLMKVGINFHFFNRIVKPRILELYNYSCSNCGVKNKRLHLHHESYEVQTINTIKPLCMSCHRKLHNRLKKNKLTIN
jgi:5-methylcytosine-specific restriction endonuclease McrA